VVAWPARERVKSGQNFSKVGQLLFVLPGFLTFKTIVQFATVQFAEPSQCRNVMSAWEQANLAYLLPYP
jgi:hypothetical protein